MRMSLLLLVLALGSPLPVVEAFPTVEEEALVEAGRTARRPSPLERRKARVVPAPATTPKPVEIPVMLRPAPHLDDTPLCPRPPPSR